MLLITNTALTLDHIPGVAESVTFDQSGQTPYVIENPVKELLNTTPLFDLLALKIFAHPNSTCFSWLQSLRRMVLQG